MRDDSAGLLDADGAARTRGRRCRTGTVFLRAPAGMLGDPGGLYPAEAVARAPAGLPGLVARDVPGTNHYTIVMARAGARAVADALDEVRLNRSVRMERVIFRRKHAVLLLAIAAWNVFTYATFTKNLAAAHAQGEDRPAGYWVAHIRADHREPGDRRGPRPARRPGLAGHRQPDGRPGRRGLSGRRHGPQRIRDADTSSTTTRTASSSPASQRGAVRGRSLRERGLEGLRRPGRRWRRAAGRR